MPWLLIVAALASQRPLIAYALGSCYVRRPRQFAAVRLGDFSISYTVTKPNNVMAKTALYEGIQLVVVAGWLAGWLARRGRHIRYSSTDNDAFIAVSQIARPSKGDRYISALVSQSVTLSVRVRPPGSAPGVLSSSSAAAPRPVRRRSEFRPRPPSEDYISPVGLTQFPKCLLAPKATGPKHRIALFSGRRRNTMENWQHLCTHYGPR